MLATCIQLVGAENTAEFAGCESSCVCFFVGGDNDCFSYYFTAAITLLHTAEHCVLVCECMQCCFVY